MILSESEKVVLLSTLLAALVSTTACAQTATGQSEDQATVWYLRHAGWAVQIDDALLVFDYQEQLQMEDVTPDTPRNLENGFIDPVEIRDLDVFVFVTHAHGDHYDPVIFEWQGEIDRLTYFIGWEEEPEPHCRRFVGAEADCFTMGGVRAFAELNDIQVHTINSHHNDIPEVAFLVQYGGWTVYHNGDYMADYVEDYAYLRTVSDRIDVAFVSGIPNRAWPHFDRAVHLAREFDVPILFPMHFPDDATCEEFAIQFAAEGVSARVRCPTARGDRFVVAKGGGAR